MGATGKRRVGMTAAVIIAALAVCIAAALAWYVGNSRHGEERDLAKAVAAGFVEKRARVEVSLAGEATGSMIEPSSTTPKVPTTGRRSCSCTARACSGRTTPACCPISRSATTCSPSIVSATANRATIRRFTRARPSGARSSPSLRKRSALATSCRAIRRAASSPRGWPPTMLSR